MLAKQIIQFFNMFLLKIDFSLSVASNFRSSRFFNLPGASAIGKDEWNTNNLPQQSAFWRKIKQIFT